MLPVEPPIEPMLAEAQETIPRGEGWVYEPKWDGFRAIVFRDEGSVRLSSRNSQPLERYFPEVVDGLKAALPPRCVVDGELFIPGPHGLDFEALQSRIHPAASRVALLSKKTPAGFAAFDVLALGDVDLRPEPFSARRRVLLEMLEASASASASALASTSTSTSTLCFPTPETPSADEAQRWFDEFEGAGCDGLIARRIELPYAPGKRVMVKVKHHRTADVVVGGFREGKTPGSVGALLLGVYDDGGKFHHLGHTSSFKAKEKVELYERLKPMVIEVSFTGRAPDTKSRWTQGKDSSWTPVTPALVCEVRYDSMLGPRFRHASTFLRWRIDKRPQECMFSQLLPPRPFSLERIVALARASR